MCILGILCIANDTAARDRVECVIQCYEVCVGTRRPAFSALCAALLNGNDCTDARTMRVAHCRPATPKTPRQSPYFQELEPYSSKPRPGWMHLFRHKDARGSTSDPKVARRSQSTLARPQGVLDLMENSWCVAIAAVGWTVHDVQVFPNADGHS